jgi:hypothetical protein
MATYYQSTSYIETVDHDDYQHALLRPSNSVADDIYVLNNYFECVDTKGYMLDAGDEDIQSTNNNLDGMVISGNKFKWNGTPGSPNTHGMFMGYNINMVVKYNYMDGVPYNILFKSGDDYGVNMNCTSGGAAYNIVKNPKMGVRSKGQDGVRIYNNTFYNSYNAGSLVYLDGNHDQDDWTSPQGVRIKNNIFYSVYDLHFFYIETGCFTDFECDYNIYYCESSSGHYPKFNVNGTNYTWSQWQALGYDTHSVIVDPDFIDLVSFVPSARLDYGTNLGSTWEEGLSTSASWVVGSIPSTATQNGTWQVGAIVYSAETPEDTYYLSPSGNDTTGNGSISQPWYTITKAMTVAVAGDTIYMRGGSYNYSTRQNIGNKNGSSGNYITIQNYPGETAVVNAATGYIYQEGIYIYDSTYIHLKGLEITGYTQPASDEWGNAIKAVDISHCIFELLNIHHNCFGISLTDDNGISTDNLILNCDVSYSEDPITSFPPPYDHLWPYGNADGITIRLDNSGQSSVNTVKGCRMWYCSDDGMDLWANEGMIIVDGCWSFWNGWYPDTFTRSPGDGNGFKLGPTYLTPYGVVLRKVRNCLAFKNPVWGFVRNGAMCNMEIYNNVAYDNGYDGSGGGFFFGNDGDGTDMPFYIKNNISYSNVNAYSFWNNESLENVDHNSWQGFTVTSADFLSLSSTGVTGPRQADGSLPELDFLKLASTSDMIGAGVNVSLTTDGAGNTWDSPPSLGAYEFITEEPSVTSITITNAFFAKYSII